MTLLAVLTTTATPEEARAVARALLDARLSPCIHVERLDSLHLWQGERREEPEWRLLAKTTEDACPEVERIIRESHSHEEPMIVALPVAAGSAGHLRWVEEGSRGPWGGPRPARSQGGGPRPAPRRIGRAPRPNWTSAPPLPKGLGSPRALAPP